MNRIFLFVAIALDVPALMVLLLSLVEPAVIPMQLVKGGTMLVLLSLVATSASRALSPWTPDRRGRMGYVVALVALVLPALVILGYSAIDPTAVAERLANGAFTLLASAILISAIVNISHSQTRDWAAHRDGRTVPDESGRRGRRASDDSAHGSRGA